MPDRIFKKSRPVGSRKPGRPPKTPKTESAPLIPVADTDQLMPTATTPTTPATVTAVGQPEAYTGLSQIEHGLVFPTFDPNAYFAQDLFTDSSPLQRTTKTQADEWVQSIEEKRQTLRVAMANFGLNQDVVKTANEGRKLEGLIIDYAITGMNNQTKYVNYQTAGLNKDIAINKWQQTAERLTQGQKTLAGMQSITPLIDQEWEARRQLKVSSISDLKTKVLKGSSQMDARLGQISEALANELQD
jgi:hypothetical protein